MRGTNRGAREDGFPLGCCIYARRFVHWVCIAALESSQGKRVAVGSRLGLLLAWVAGAPLLARNLDLSAGVVAVSGHSASAQTERQRRGRY